ncbi:MAG: pyrrolo-quinoline quinone [Clostridia bacterium]|nr:pyrrolo-quinoline quinone [Clostridia bacterium]
MPSRQTDEFDPMKYFGEDMRAQSGRGVSRNGPSRQGQRGPSGSGQYARDPRARGEYGTGNEYGRSARAPRSASSGRVSSGSGKPSGPYRGGKNGRKRRKKRRAKPAFYILIALLLLILAAVLFLLLRKPAETGEQEKQKQPNTISSLFVTASPTPSPTPEPTPTPTPTPKFDIPHAVDATRPENFGYVSGVEVNGTEVSSYQRPEPIAFGTGDEYTDAEGIVTFRGNNFRNTGSYGTASVEKKNLSIAWTVETGEIMRGTSANYSGFWTGSLWCGQPLAVKWPESTKRIMNMYDSAKNDPGLVEVIYATASGKIHFLNLYTGEPTRDPISLNMPFKGAGALDPRGYPLLYLGSGDMYDDYPDMQTRAMVVSLIDGTVLYEFGKAYDPFAIRKWHAYDSSPLVSAETDTLIYPGENGIIYTIHLNTVYDEQAGTISVHPDEVAKYRYNTSRSSANSAESDKYWLGFESSVTAWGEYMYLASNDGFVHCININTLKPVWIQDIGDDSNSSLVLEEDEPNRTAYLYAAQTVHFTQGTDDIGYAPVYKLDAVTGEILWKNERKVHTNSSARGGVQATAVLGQGNMSDLIVIPYEKTYTESDPENAGLGYTVAINKHTGETVWEKKTNFAWSSPVAVYDEAGNGYIIQPDSHGDIYLFNGLTGERYCILDTKSKNYEATGIAYGNMFVIGNKDHKILGIRIS